MPGYGKLVTPSSERKQDNDNQQPKCRRETTKTRSLSWHFLFFSFILCYSDYKAAQIVSSFLFKFFFKCSTEVGGTSIGYVLPSGSQQPIIPSTLSVVNLSPTMRFHQRPPGDATQAKFFIGREVTQSRFSVGGFSNLHHKLTFASASFYLVKCWLVPSQSQHDTTSSSRLNSHQDVETPLLLNQRELHILCVIIMLVSVLVCISFNLLNNYHSNHRKQQNTTWKLSQFSVAGVWLANTRDTPLTDGWTPGTPQTPGRRHVSGNKCICLPAPRTQADTLIIERWSSQGDITLNELWSMWQHPSCAGPWGQVRRRRDRWADGSETTFCLLGCRGQKANKTFFLEQLRNILQSNVIYSSCLLSCLELSIGE